MTNITHEALIERGFRDTSWEYEGQTFTEHARVLGGISIEVSDTDLVEIGIRGEWVTVPNCRTLTDLDNLIKLFV